jgi:2-oxoglutarate dehydrogenase E2 component (dihydrolipoamide succinyltransferase)
MALVDIRMFSEQQEGTESFLGTWLKKLGEAVTENEPVIEISTDKVSMEIPAPASGVLAEILKSEKDPVTPGEVLGRIEVEPRESAPARDAAEGLSPAVRRLLQEHNLDPRSIPASGRGGRLSYEDVADFLAKQKPAAKAASRMVPHTAMRRSIASHMLRSVQSAPHVTAVFEADLSRVLADRERRRNASEEAPSVTAYLILAAVEALKAVPEVNSKWHEDALEIFEDFNIGVGTAIEGGGLIVPVIHRAQDLDLDQIAGRLRELTAKARAGTLTLEEVQNGTFTISNHGVSGSLVAAPIIIAHSQTAILGVGKLQKRPVAVEEGGRDLIRIQPMMYVTLTVDHRALDAQQTNAFLTAYVRAIEHDNGSRSGE